MHLMGERKERVAAAFADLLYDKDTSPHTKKPLQLTALLLPCDKTSLVKICCTGVLPQHHIHAKAQTPLYSDGVQLQGLTSALSANPHPRSPGTPPAASSPPCDRQQKPPALHTSQNQPLLRVTRVMWDINVVPTDIISILPAKPQTYHYEVIVWWFSFPLPQPWGSVFPFLSISSSHSDRRRWRLAQGKIQFCLADPSSGSPLHHVKLGENHYQLRVSGTWEHPRHCHTQSLQGPGLRGSWCTSQTLYLWTSVLQERAGKILSLSSPVSGYNSDVQQTVHYLSCILGEQRFSRDGWGVEHHRSGLQAARKPLEHDTCVPPARTPSYAFYEPAQRKQKGLKGDGFQPLHQKRQLHLQISYRGMERCQSCTCV